MRKLWILPLLPLMCSCGTIVNGTSQPVCVTSCPSQANVWVDNCYLGTTPVRARLTRSDCHVITVAIDGQPPQQMFVDRRLSGWAFGNVVFGGVVGVAIDAVSGGLYKLTPDQTHACFNQPQLAKLQTDDGIQVAVVEKVEEDWEQVGIF